MMNKLGLPMAFIALIGMIGGFFYFKSKTQPVYVDINKLMEGYDRTKVERKIFVDKSNSLRANVDSLMTNWQNELKSYEKEKVSMSKNELELKQQLLGNKQQQLNNYQQAIQQQISEDEQQMTQTLINDINDYVKEYGKKNGYPIIFGANGKGNIMYAEDGADLSEEVLKVMNQEYGAK